jgi:hypothetical protein
MNLFEWYRTLSTGNKAFVILMLGGIVALAGVTIWAIVSNV